MLNTQCRHYDTCSAPLCPLDESSLERGVFYLDEEVCSRRGMPTWVGKQRKLAKVAAKTKSPDSGFFSVRMLEAIQKIGRGVRGADPADSDSEEKWLKERRHSQTVSKARTTARTDPKKSRTTARRKTPKAISINKRPS